MRHLFSKIDSNFYLLLLLSLFAWAPLLTPAYFFDAHDAKHSVFFLVEFDQTFRDGYLWPRWSPDFAFGYGYPLFNMYAPLAFYAAEILVLLGWGFTAAIKTMYILATIGAGLSMYGFAGRLYGSRAGLLAGVMYMYVPFHLVEIYVRSAYAEFVSLALIPLLFWAFTELVAAPSLRRLAGAGLVYGLLALTHHTSFFTFSPFLMVYILYLILAKARLNLKSLLRHSFYAAGAGILGLMLAAIYLIPMVLETRYIKIEQWTSGSYNYLQHFVYFSQFFLEEWGYGYAGPGILDDFSYQLGVVMVCLLCFGLVAILIRRFPHRATALFFLISTGVVILLMSPVAEPLWQVLPIASLVQFPWRLLAMTAFTMALVAGALVAALAGEGQGQSSQVATGASEALGVRNAFRTPKASPVEVPEISKIEPSLAPAIDSSGVSAPTPALYLLLLVVILGSFNYTLPQYTEIPTWSETPLAVINWDRASIVDRVGMVAATQEQPQTSPMEQQYLNGEPLVTAGIIAGQGRVEMIHHGGASDVVRVIAEMPVTLQFYTYDYPGWRVTLNAEPIPHRPEPPYGLVTVEVPEGVHEVALRMGSTRPRMVGGIISGIAGVVIVVLGLFSPRRFF